MSEKPSVRICLIEDMLEEQWPSMDLFAEMLARELPNADPSLHIESLRLPLRRRLGSLPACRSRRTADRLLTRHLDYPRALRKKSTSADVYHILDHTYAASVNSLRGRKTVVTCHDLDAFQMVHSDRTLAKPILAHLARITLKGLCRSSHIVCDSENIRRELVTRGWAELERTSVIPPGVHPSCTTAAGASDPIAKSLLDDGAPAILHVSSTISRKRIDTLLQSFAAILADYPAARLTRVGGEFTESQNRMVAELGLRDSITVLPFLDRTMLSAVYRRATILVLPSEREGFGLPVVEAMACGTPVLLSDIPVLREVGGPAASYAPVGDAHAWTNAILELLREHVAQPKLWADRIEAGRAHAKNYSWSEHALALAQLYHSLARR